MSTATTHTQDCRAFSTRDHWTRPDTERCGACRDWARRKAEATKPTDQRIADALREAQPALVAHDEDAFWASISKSFPEVRTGDYTGAGVVDDDYGEPEPPEAALRLWLMLNHPSNG